MKKHVMSGLLVSVFFLLLIASILLWRKGLIGGDTALMLPRPNSTFLLLVAVLFGMVLLGAFLMRQIAEIRLYLQHSEHNLKRQIRESVESKFIEISPTAKDVLEVAVEIWKVEQRIGKLQDKLPENQSKGLSGSFARLRKFLEGYGIEVKGFTGSKYSQGMAAMDVISVEKDPDAQHDYVKETIEPAIFTEGRIAKKARVIIASSITRNP
ncbi:MAG: hypothetical protein PHX87_02610 [Candidatus Peribacteraceae bacterium]|nr:hypothetical protein [Candidatus Peribacteraceae bacterium]